MTIPGVAMVFIMRNAANVVPPVKPACICQ